MTKFIKYIKSPPFRNITSSTIKQRYREWYRQYDELVSNRIYITPQLFKILHDRSLPDSGSADRDIDCIHLADNITKDDVNNLLEEMININIFEKQSTILNEFAETLLYDGVFLKTCIIIFFIDIVKSHIESLFTNESFDSLLLSAKKYSKQKKKLSDHELDALVNLQISFQLLTKILYGELFERNVKTDIPLNRHKLLHGRFNQVLSIMHYKTAFIYLHTVISSYKNLIPFASNESNRQENNQIILSEDISQLEISTSNYMNATSSEIRASEFIYNLPKYDMSDFFKIAVDLIDKFKNLFHNCRQQVMKFSEEYNSDPQKYQALLDQIIHNLFETVIANNCSNIRLVPSKQLLDKYYTILLFNSNDDLRGKLMLQYERNSNYISDLCDYCLKLDSLPSIVHDLLLDSIYSFKHDQFQIACFGMILIVEHLASVIASAKEVIEEKDYKKIRLSTCDSDDTYTALYKSVLDKLSSMYDRSFFCNEELLKDDNLINRHAIVHGRSKNLYDKIDVINLLVCTQAYLDLISLRK